jgi:hypothetical protein
LLAGVMGAVVVADEEHGGWDAGVGEDGRVVAGARMKTRAQRRLPLRSVRATALASGAEAELFAQVSPLKGSLWML